MSEPYDRDAHPYDRPKHTPEQQLQVIKIIWVALLLGPNLILGVFHFVRAASPQPMAVSALLPMVVISFVLAVVMPIVGRFLAAATVRSARSRTPVPEPTQVFLTSTILAGATCEGAMLFAAVTYFVTGERLVLLAFAIALGAMFTVRPTDERYTNVQTTLS
jgi:hypothetical protein